MNRLSEYYTAIAAKRLTVVDAEPNRSNQHEFGGLQAAGFGMYLGSPNENTLKFDAKFLYYNDVSTNPIIDEGVVSWYDARRHKAHRGPELRLYYQSNLVTQSIAEGDLMIIAKRPDDTLQLFFSPPDTAIGDTLCYLFDVSPDQQPSFVVNKFDVHETALDLVRSSILQLLDVAPIENRLDPDFEDLVTAHFGNIFPSTREFSAFARDTLEDVDPVEKPDETLLLWMQREESLFFALEKVLVEEKLAAGFEDVDDFIGFSLGVQNRRKSRAGWALERHLAEIFHANGLDFDCGVMTENRSKPDFLFPGAIEYHNPGTAVDSLLMLGVKTSCKDRWRQVLSEAQRIPNKHLLTLETAISESQLAEMNSNNLTLVVPAPLHVTYKKPLRTQLFSLSDFIALAHAKQSTRSNGHDI